MRSQLSDNINKDKIFIVPRSRAQERLDAQYHREDFDFTGYHRLSEYVYINGGKRIPKGLNYSTDPDSPFLYLRVADLTDDYQINYDNIKRIDESLYKVLHRYSINNGEIALSIAGSIGKVLLLHNIPQKYRVILTENCAKISVKSAEQLYPEYLSILLTLSIVQKQIMLNYIQTTIPKLSLERIGRIMIPTIPDKSKQQNIIETYYSALLHKQHNYKKAQSLLDSIDEFLYSELGIVISSGHESTIRSRIFTVNLNSFERDRLDSNYFDIKYRNLLNYIHNGKYELDTLGSITSFLSTGQTPQKKSYSEEKTDYPIIKVSSYNGFEIDLKKTGHTINKQSCFAHKGDIFILSSAHQAQYVAKQIYYLDDIPLPNTSFVGELLCVRANRSVNSMFLYSLLSTTLYKTLLNREKRGQTSHLYSQDVKRVIIPIPPLDKQNEIASHIESIRLQARALQEEGHMILEKTKHEIEKQIMG